MPYQEIPLEIEIVAGGAATALSVDDPYTLYNVISTGTVTVAVINSMTVSGTPLEGHKFVFHYTADVSTASVANVEIFVTAIPTEYLSTELWIDAYYNGTTWDISFHPDFLETAVVTPTHLREVPSSLIDYTDTTISTANLGGEQELISLEIPANTFEDNGDGFKLTIWGTCTAVPAELKTITVKVITGAVTRTLYTNGTVTDIVGDWRLDVNCILTNLGIGSITPSGCLYADANGAVDVDPYTALVKPLGYDATVTQYVKIYGTETTPSGAQISVVGTRLSRD